MRHTDEDVLTAGLNEDPFPDFSRKRRRGVQVTSAAALALGLALTGGSVAGAAATTPPSNSSGPSGSSGWAAPGRPPKGASPPVATGKVKSVGDGTFTVTTRNGTTVTVDVGASTTYRDRGVSAPTLANVTVGEQVAAFGTRQADVVTATSVTIGGPPGGGPGGQKGTGRWGPGRSSGTPPEGTSPGTPPKGGAAPGPS